MSDDDLLPVAPKGSLRGDGRRGRRRLGEILLQRGAIDELALASALAEQAGLDLVDPTAVALDEALLAGFDLDLALAHRLLPLYAGDDGRVTVAVADPTDQRALKAAWRFLDAPVDPVVAPGPAIDAAIAAAIERSQAEPEPPPPAGLDIPPAPPPVGPLASAAHADPSPEAWSDLLAGLVAHMLQLGADRLRFTAWDGGGTGQLRVAGRWARVLSVEADAADRLIDGLVAGFDANEDGSLRLALGGSGEGKDLVARVSVKSAGRQLDARIFAPQAEIPLDELGLDPEVQRRLRQWTASREGVLLFVGPDASGRSTTLRALAASLGQYRDSVLVGEGPAPTSEGVRFVDDAGGLAAIHEALRMRPRVLFVDDITDGEQAATALSTGKDDTLVVCAISGHDASDALQSLRERGVPDPLLGERLLGVVEQRLVPALCPACRTKAPANEDACRKLGIQRSALPREVAARGAGCPQCHGHGTHGRALLATRVELGGGITPGCSAADLRGRVDAARPRTAVEAGIALLTAGQVGLSSLAQCLAPDTNRPVVSATASQWLPGMPEETVEASSPVLESGSFEGFLELEPDGDRDGRHTLLLFDPRDESFQGIAAVLPKDACRVIAASEWEEAMSVVQHDTPAAILLLAAGDPVATRGRIRSFRDELRSALLPICVLVPPGTPSQELLETGADQVVAVSDAATVRSGLLDLLARVT